MFDIKESLKNLPDTPGVYLHKDGLGQVIYVGKAINLKRRVSSYFQKSKNHSQKVKTMVKEIAEFEYINCSTEMEAFILECNLIKKYQPKYNVLLRDDKTYPYIKVTTNEEYPRLIKTRVLSRDGAKYFGPYSDVKAVNDIVELLNKLYSLKRCAYTSFPKGYRPCLNYHIKKCQGVCLGNIDKVAYCKNIEKIIDFLSGKRKEIKDYVISKMNEASDSLNYEKAATYRNYLEAINSLSEVQRVSIVNAKDFDMVLPITTEKNSVIILFTVRDGKLSSRETFDMTSSINDDKGEVVSQFIKQYYINFPNPPHEIVLENEVEDMDLISAYISEDKPHKVSIIVPERGSKKALLNLAIRDRDELKNTLDIKIENEKEKELQLTKSLSVLAGVEKEKYRVESYDISNTNGIDTVGAMVVFSNLKPIRKDYRRFKIKTIEGQNDYGALEEMLTRRFNRLKMDDKSFNTKPDMILMDGGLGQVRSAYKVAIDLGIDVPIYGMAKDDNHRTRALINVKGDEISLKDYPLLFKYCGTIQEEVHRFAIEYHRNVRNKNSIGSILDNINGIGEKKRNILLKAYNSIDEIKRLSEEELTLINGITKKDAKNIYEFFHQEEEK